MTRNREDDNEQVCSWKGTDALKTLRALVESGDIEGYKAFLKTHAENDPNVRSQIVNYCFEDDTTALMIAVRKKNEAFARMLVEKEGADVSIAPGGQYAHRANRQNFFGNYPADVIKQLKKGRLNATCNPSFLKIPIEGSKMLLHVLAEEGNLTNLKALATHENFQASFSETINLLDPETGKTVLHCADSRNRVLVKWLIDEAGVDPNAQDNEGNTVYHMAAGKGDEKLIAILESRNVNRALENKEGKRADQLDASVLTIVAKKAKFLKRAPISQNPLQLRYQLLFEAINEDDKAKAETFFSNDKSAALDHLGLVFLKEAMEFGAVDVFILLIEKLSSHGFTISSSRGSVASSSRGSTASSSRGLTTGSRDNNSWIPDQVRDDDMRDDDMQNGGEGGAQDDDMQDDEVQSDSVSALIATNINRVVTVNGVNRTLLQIAAQRGAVESVTRLLALGADINATDPNGWTALHIAAHHAKHEVVHVLLKEGANFDKREMSPSKSRADQVGCAVEGEENSLQQCANAIVEMINFLRNIKKRYSALPEQLQSGALEQAYQQRMAFLKEHNIREELLNEECHSRNVFRVEALAALLRKNPQELLIRLRSRFEEHYISEENKQWPIAIRAAIVACNESVPDFNQLRDFIAALKKADPELTDSLEALDQQIVKLFQTLHDELTTRSRTDSETGSEQTDIAKMQEEPILAQSKRYKRHKHKHKRRHRKKETALAAMAEITAIEIPDRFLSREKVLESVVCIPKLLPSFRKEAEAAQRQIQAGQLEKIERYEALFSEVQALQKQAPKQMPKDEALWREIREVASALKQLRAELSVSSSELLSPEDLLAQKERLDRLSSRRIGRIKSRLESAIDAYQHEREEEQRRETADNVVTLIHALNPQLQALEASLSQQPNLAETELNEFVDTAVRYAQFINGFLNVEASSSENVSSETSLTLPTDSDRVARITPEQYTAFENRVRALQQYLETLVPKVNAQVEKERVIKARKEKFIAMRSEIACEIASVNRKIESIPGLLGEEKVNGKQLKALLTLRRRLKLNNELLSPITIPESLPDNVLTKLNKAVGKANRCVDNYIQDLKENNGERLGELLEVPVQHLNEALIALKAACANDPEMGVSILPAVKKLRSRIGCDTTDKADFVLDDEKLKNILPGGHQALLGQINALIVSVDEERMKHPLYALIKFYRDTVVRLAVKGSIDKNILNCDPIAERLSTMMEKIKGSPCPLVHFSGYVDLLREIHEELKQTLKGLSSKGLSSIWGKERHREKIIEAYEPELERKIAELQKIQKTQTSVVSHANNPYSTFVVVQRPGGEGGDDANRHSTPHTLG